MRYANCPRCPYCGGARVQFSHTTWKHYVRMLLGSKTRYCFDCDRKWYDALRGETGTMSRQQRFLILVGAGVSLMIAALATLSWNPIDWIKKLVVKHYDSTYGADSKKKLWQDLGGSYSSRDEAQGDYNDHK